MPISLAAFRYRQVLAVDDGPIDRLETMDTMVLGHRQFLANAYLRADLIEARTAPILYSQASGSGTAASPIVARFIAISEAMERWSYAALHHSDDGKKYGFDVDPSSNGMAAFPGILSRHARPAALMEAAERFNLLNWWEGRLPALEATTRWPGVMSVSICSDAPGITVILYKSTESGFIAYGHAAALDFEEACRKAAIEMERHAHVVSAFAATHGGHIRNQLPKEAHPIERRSLFFALEEGHELFLSRLRSQVSKPTLPPKLIFDGSIPGPWARYADVWRIVYAPPSDQFLSSNENYFLW